MISLYDLIMLKFPKARLMQDFKLSDYGNGPEIAEWNIPDVPKPDQATLDQWAIEVAPIKQLQETLNNRRAEYPPIGDQLDAMLKHFESQNLSSSPELKTVVLQWQSIKEKYPK